MKLLKFRPVAFALTAIGILAFMGCSQQAAQRGATQVGEDSHAGHDHAEGEGHSQEASHDHGGWWCAEHGVPEEDCSMCSTKAAAKFKENGDWCDEHNRAESQCFQCDASRADKFAKLYEAKFGEKPPKPTE